MDNQEEESRKKTLWHQILGRIFTDLLTPLKITVSTDVKVMIKAPEADIVLLRREHRFWTKAQRERLPDGIRDSQAAHILIEFKATESLSKETFIQAGAYEYFYKQSQELADEEIQTFVICAIQPQKANREQYGYTIRVQPGVYQSDNLILKPITLISLNELPDELHNAWVTCLASQKRKRLKAFTLLGEEGFKFIPKPFKWFIIELWQLISIKEDDDMALNLNPQEIKKIGEMWGANLFSPDELKEVLSKLPVEERLKGLKIEERFIGLTPEERLKGLKIEERFIGLTPEEQLKGLKIEERFIGLKPEERLAGLSPSEMEELEKKLKEVKQGNG